MKAKIIGPRIQGPQKLLPDNTSKLREIAQNKDFIWFLIGPGGDLSSHAHMITTC